MVVEVVEDSSLEVAEDRLEAADLSSEAVPLDVVVVDVQDLDVVLVDAQDLDAEGVAVVDAVVEVPAAVASLLVGFQALAAEWGVLL